MAEQQSRCSAAEYMLTLHVGDGKSGFGLASPQRVRVQLVVDGGAEQAVARVRARGW